MSCQVTLTNIPRVDIGAPKWICDLKCEKFKFTILVYYIIFEEDKIYALFDQNMHTLGITFFGHLKDVWDALGLLWIEKTYRIPIQAKIKNIGRCIHSINY